VNDQVQSGIELTLAGAGQATNQVMAMRPDFIEDVDNAKIFQEAPELAKIADSMRRNADPLTKGHQARLELESSGKER
jgi:hypothetical protein